MMTTLLCALVDAVFDWKRFGTVPRVFTWIKHFRNDHEIMSALVDATLRYGDRGTVRRIGYVLERARVDARLSEKLRHKFNPNSGLIPLVTYFPTQCGIANDRWGVVINGKWVVGKFESYADLNAKGAVRKSKSRPLPSKPKA